MGFLPSFATALGRNGLFQSRILGILSLILLATLPTRTKATKHSFTAFADSRGTIGPVGIPFGFLDGGHFELTVFDFELITVGKPTTPPHEILNSVEAGFFLQRYENEAAFWQHMEILRANTSLCAFDYFRDVGDDDLAIATDDTFVDPDSIPSADHGILLSMKKHKTWKPNPPTTIEYTFKSGEAGLYFLIYQICPHNSHIRSSFAADFHFMNYDALGNMSYLSAGEMRLPLLFFFFSVSYLVCFVVWFTNNRELLKGRPGHFHQPTAATTTAGGSRKSAAVYPIHHLMSVLLLLKFLSVFFESIRYHAIRIVGHAEFWSTVYYLFTFIKGTFLFTVILLIGTGWSFVKPFLNEREKKVIFLILVLQVINNIALTILSNETEGEKTFEGWTAVLHLVDIACCCAVLLPIVWQVNALEKSVGADEEGVDQEEREMGLESGEKGQILTKLQLFRHFYLLVVAYIYSTRILVYLFATMLDYQHLWVRYFVVEIVTLAFYVVVGLMFRPQVDNPYLSIKRDEETVALHNGVEMENIDQIKKN